MPELTDRSGQFPQIDNMSTFLNSFIEQFSNRDIAIAILMIIVLIMVIRDKSVRRALFSIPKAAMHWEIVTIFLSLFVYIGLFVYCLDQLEIWDANHHLKDTMIWAIFVALPMVVKINDATRDDRFFGKFMVNALKLTIVLEFFVDLFPFSLSTELVLISVLMVLGILLAYAKVIKGNSAAEGLFNGLFVIIGLILLVRAAIIILADLDAYLNLDQFIDMAMPSILTIMLLPFVYVLALIFVYQSLFIRFDIQNSNAELIRYAKVRTLWHFGPNLNRLTEWSKQNIMVGFYSKEDFHMLLGIV